MPIGITKYLTLQSRKITTNNIDMDIDIILLVSLLYSLLNELSRWEKNLSSSTYSRAEDDFKSPCKTCYHLDVNCYFNNQNSIELYWKYTFLNLYGLKIY